MAKSSGTTSYPKGFSGGQGKASGTTSAPKGSGTRAPSGTTPKQMGVSGGSKFPAASTNQINNSGLPIANNPTGQLHQRHGSGTPLTGEGQHEQGARDKKKTTRPMTKNGGAVTDANTKTNVAFAGQSGPFNPKR